MTAAQRRRAVEHLKSRRERHLEQLFELLQIPSISALPGHKEDVRRAAEFLVEDLQSMGLENVGLIACTTISFSSIGSRCSWLAA